VDGALVSESLREGAELALPLRLRRISRFEVEDATSGQPGRWTLIEFSADDDLADEVADACAGALEESGGWYADFHTPETKYVVFGGRVFRYPRGDDAGKRDAQQYARSVGVPETQLDWSD
jgi:hypothetical protein